MSQFSYYKQQSMMTDPGEYAPMYDALPDNIAGICKAVQGLLIHYVADGYRPPADRVCEIDTRYTSAILQRIVEMDDRPLTEPRSLEQRFVGCCRDYSVLTVSILRHKGIPARVRYGTGAYFEPNFYGDHAILEYWNGTRWVAVDAEMSPAHIQRHNIAFDVLDVPNDQFIRGGRGWLMCRREGADPQRFGLSAKLPLRGAIFVLTELLLDLAALNKVEMLCWDSWGIVRRFDTLTTEEQSFLDQVAEATLDNNRFAEWATLFQHDDLILPDTIESYSPAAKKDQMPIIVQWQT